MALIQKELMIHFEGRIETKMLTRNFAKEMMLHLIRDPWTSVCAVGTTLMLAAEWISTHINPVIAMVGGFLGLIMLILGIFEKAISIRKLLKAAKEKTDNKNL